MDTSISSQNNSLEYVTQTPYRTYLLNLEKRFPNMQFAMLILSGSHWVLLNQENQIPYPAKNLGLDKYLKFITSYKPTALDQNWNALRYLSDLPHNFQIPHWITGVPGICNQKPVGWVLINTLKQYRPAWKTLIKIQNQFNKFLIPIYYHSQTVEKFSKSENEKDSALITLAHQVKSPLNHLQVVLEEWDTNVNASKSLTICKETISKAHLFITDYLNIQKQKQNVFIKFSLSSLYHELNLYFQYHPSFEKIDLNFNPSTLLHSEILGSFSLLFQVFQNILENASRAMNNLGKIQIKTTCSKTGSLLYIHIEDSGPGISLSQIDALFKTFDSKSRGSGVGLFICREILNWHRGNIEYIPKSTHIPSTFQLQIPIAIH